MCFLPLLDESGLLHAHDAHTIALLTSDLCPICLRVRYEQPCQDLSQNRKKIVG